MKTGATGSRTHGVRDRVDDILVVGEALVDIIIAGHGARIERPGGSPANVALGLGRLGRNAHLLTCLGKDRLGAAVRTHLSTSNVTVLEASPATSTATATATLQADGSATYDFDIHWDVDIRAVDHLSPVLVHLGSVAATMPPNAGKIQQVVDRFATSALITYDPNIRPSIVGSRDAALLQIDSLIPRCDIVKASMEDIAWLYPRVPVQTTAEKWAQRGPAIVVLTNGSAGASVWCRTASFAVPAQPASVVDTIGAGDSFMAALIHSILSSASTREELGALTSDQVRRALEFATSAASLTVSRTGADLPSLTDLVRPRPVSHGAEVGQSSVSAQR